MTSFQNIKVWNSGEFIKSKWHIFKVSKLENQGNLQNQNDIFSKYQSLKIWEISKNQNDTFSNYQSLEIREISKIKMAYFQHHQGLEIREISNIKMTSFQSITV